MWTRDPGRSVAFVARRSLLGEGGEAFVAVVAVQRDLVTVGFDAKAVLERARVRGLDGHLGGTNRQRRTSGQLGEERVDRSGELTGLYDLVSQSDFVRRACGNATPQQDELLGARLADEPRQA